MMNGFGGMNIFGGFWMVLESLVLLGLLALLVWGVSGLFPRQSVTNAGNAGNAGNQKSTDPIEILKRRYAAGEISQAEFEIVRKSLA